MWTPGLTVAFVKILGLKTHWIWFLDTQNTFYLMVKGLKNAYLMHFLSLLFWFHCRVCFYLKCSSSLSQRGVNPYGQPDRKISAFFFDDFPKANRVIVQYCRYIYYLVTLYDTAVVCYTKVCYNMCWQDGCQWQLLTSSELHTITVLCAEEANKPTMSCCWYLLWLRGLTSSILHTNTNTNANTNTNKKKNTNTNLLCPQGLTWVTSSILHRHRVHCVPCRGGQIWSQLLHMACIQFALS